MQVFRGTRLALLGMGCADGDEELDGPECVQGDTQAHVQACAATGARAVVPGVRGAGVAPNDRAYNSLAGAGPGPQRTSTHSTISAIQIHLT